MYVVGFIPYHMATVQPQPFKSLSPCYRYNNMQMPNTYVSLKIVIYSLHVSEMSIADNGFQWYGDLICLFKHNLTGNKKQLNCLDNKCNNNSVGRGLLHSGQRLAGQADKSLSQVPIYNAFILNKAKAEQVFQYTAALL